MRRLAKHLRAALRALYAWANYGAAWRACRPDAAPVGEWSDDDAHKLAHFYSTEVGARLWAQVRAQEARNNSDAVLSAAKCREYTCGVAAGFRAGAAYILTLSQTLPAQAQETQRAPDETADASETRARLSP